MDVEAFKAQLTRDGYDEIVEKEMQAGVFIDEHTHPYDVRALVLGGSAVIACGGESKTYAAGDIVEMAANTVHTEQYGDQPYKFLVGRRNK
ncbi:MAG: cupin domain-containing protein [Burkholderiaceae bacterium]